LADNLTGNYPIPKYVDSDLRITEVPLEAQEPRKYTIPQYCAEEVQRQNPGNWDQAEELLRVGYMLRAWATAMSYALIYVRPTTFQINIMGQMMEPTENTGLRKNGIGILDTGTGVRKKMGCDWTLIGLKMADLLEAWDRMEPLDWYRAFLEIHPFNDGNGRVGKILLNWRNGTLKANPIFPPHDFWGEPIKNP
jgi:hypothetical protein